MRFSIRTSLLFFALLAIIFPATEVATRDYRKRLRIQADLLSMGAYYVGFDENSNPDWVSFVAPVSSSQIAKYKSIESIDPTGARVTDDSIRHIAGLDAVRMIHLTECDITDAQLELLANIRSLKILRLNGSRVSDAAIPTIASINDLISVDLSGTLITEDGVSKLKNRCPGIVVRFEPQ